MAKTIQKSLLPRHWQEARQEIALSAQLLADRLSNWLQANWFRLLIIGLLVWILMRKDLTLQLSLKNQTQLPASAAEVLTKAAAEALLEAAPLTASADQQQIYVQRFAKVAQTEMRRFGIPASITLAQGLLETNAGASPLAVRNNNHFGIKCFSRSCTRGHCSNFSDDTHKDFFRRYPSAWESFRSHSQLLQSDRYRPLFRLDRTDYRGWARGLSKAGYATDKQYAEKLIDVIERLELNRYDS